MEAAMAAPATGFAAAARRVALPPIWAVRSAFSPPGSDLRSSEKRGNCALGRRKWGVRKGPNWAGAIKSRRMRPSSARTEARTEEEEAAVAAPFSSGSSGSWDGSRIPAGDDLGGGEMGAEDKPSSSKQQPAMGVFPGGKRRAEVRIPGLVFRIRAPEVLEKAAEFLGFLSAALAGGLTMVILETGAADGETGARLYEAACALKSALRGRAALLVAERVDIAAAAGADGVVLSDDGLPTLIARRMMKGVVPDAGALPLVARTVKSTQSAKSATALEGADLLLLLQGSEAGDLNSTVRSVCEEVSIPVFLDATRSSSSRSFNEGQAKELLNAGASGMVVSAKELMGRDDAPGYVAALSSAMTVAAQQQQSSVNEVQSDPGISAGSVGQDFRDVSRPMTDKRAPLVLDLDAQAKLILEDERKLLTNMIEFVQAASPEMQEISLLLDALKQLDELFLLVIVGEFNSGKSSVINALLGKRFLREGVLPTTNEITLLRHSGDGHEGGERSERHPDGHFLRFIPAELLKQMNLVDTPGTNVILQRQQRLTEEFVPRADLVLFVLSVDRALTESEITFLRYIRQWGKKIIFILNKADTVAEKSELEELKSFVKDNAQSLLGVEQIVVYPVSARRALFAKTAAANATTGAVDRERLRQDQVWRTSGFAELEDFIYDFLEGSSDAGAERMRLKLDTPLGIGVALLDAADRQLSADMDRADMDLNVLDQIDEQLLQYRQAMLADAELQRRRAADLVAAAKDRAGKFVDSVVRLTNIEAGIQYLFSSSSDERGSMPVSRAFDKQVLGSAISDIQRVLEEHGAWLVANLAKQTKKYGEMVRTRWPDVPAVDRKASGTNGSEPAAAFESFAGDKLGRPYSESALVLKEFDVRAAEILLEQEVREAVLGTFGGLGIAGVAASILTSVLPNTVDDLLALAVCTAGGFVGVYNLPSRRRDVKQKINKVAGGIARQLGQAMEADLQQTMEQLVEGVRAMTSSYRSAAEGERARVLRLQRHLDELDASSRELRQRVQNLGN